MAKKRIPAKKKAKKAEVVQAASPSLTDEQIEARKSARATVTDLEKKFGKGIVMRLGTSPLKREIPTVSTGSIGLNEALGVGGMPYGRVAEIYGPESSGKTTLALHIVAHAQKQGHICAFIDAEHALDIEYASDLGVDIDELLLSQPDCGEQALEVTDNCVSGGGIKVVVIDSVAALTPRAELEGEMGDHHVGLQARLMSQALRKLTGTVSRNGAIVLFINQIRMKIGVKFGSPETTSGGNALKFYSSVRLDIRRIGAIKKGSEDGTEFLGNRTRVKVVKNKVAPPFRQAEFDIIYGKGISMAGEILDIGVGEGIVEKAGAWYSYGSERIGQGRENAKNFLIENPDMMEQIRKQLEG